MEINALDGPSRVPMGGLSDEESLASLDTGNPVFGVQNEEFTRIKEVVKRDIETGKRANENDRALRVKHYDAYRAKGDGKADRPGRSRIKCSDIMDCIEWMMPSFMKAFGGSTEAVSVSPVGTEDVDKADRLQKLLNWQFMSRHVNGFNVLYEWIKTSLIYGTSVVKVTWRDKYKEKGFDIPVVSYEAMQQLVSDESVRRLDGSTQDIEPGTVLSQDVLDAASGSEQMLSKIGQMNAGNMGVQPIALEPLRVYRDVRGIRRIKVYSGPVVEVISPEDFYMDPEARTIEEAQFVIHRVWRTYGELKSLEREGIYKGVEDVKAFINRDKSFYNDEEAARYAAAGMEEPSSVSEYGAEEQTARRKLEVFEWWGLVDLKDNGFQEPYLVVYCGDTILRMEKNPYGHGQAPFEVLRPMLDPFKFSGVGMPELVGEFQEIKTALMRQTLDNISFQNNGMWLVNRNAGIDMNALLNPRPGTIVRTNIVAGAVQPITPTSLQSMPLSMIELMDSFMQKRTGVTSYNQGLDANSLNKMLALDTPIPLADGSVKLNKDVVAGDMVIGSDGSPTEVLEAHPVQMPERAFALTFENGDVIHAGGEHLWTVAIRDKRGKYSEYETLPTERIFDILSDGVHVAVVPRVQAVAYAEKELVMDPYILGAWIGDGHSHTNRFTSMDEEITERFRAWAGLFYGGHIEPCKTQNAGAATTYSIVDTPFRKMLKDLGVLKDVRYAETKDNEKHIPDAYFTASKVQRLELLRGLMDTDGCRYKYQGRESDSSAVFCTSNERLMKDFCRLVDSLGGIPKATSREPHTQDGRKYRRHYHISFTMEDCPFSLIRKSVDWKPNVHTRRNRIVSVVEIERKPMRCLSVAAEDRMYCCGEHFTVTRNTATGITKIMNASAQRIELIARIMAETGIRPLYQKLLMLDQQFIDQTIVIRVFNQPLEISPDDLAGDFDVSVDVGGASNKDETRVQQMLMMLQYAGNLMQMGVMRPENVYSVTRKMMELWGWKDYEKYLSDPQENQALSQVMQIITQLAQNVQNGVKLEPQTIVQAFRQIYQLVNGVLGASAQQNIQLGGSPSNSGVSAAGGGSNAGEYSATTIPGRSAYSGAQM